MEDGLITTKEVGDYRIKIYYDPDGTCPCKCNEITMDRVFGCLGNEKFYICQPMAFHQILQNIQERSGLYAFKIATAYFREQGLVPVFEDCHCKLMKL